MARALVRCSVMPVAIAWSAERQQIGRSTLEALLRHELLREAESRKGTRVWRPTDRGVAIIRASRPVLLAARSQYGYVSDVADAMLGEPEVLDGGGPSLSRASDRAGADVELLAERRGLELELADLKRLADERGVDIRNDLRVIQGRVDKIRERLMDQHAARWRAELDDALRSTDKAA